MDEERAGAEGPEGLGADCQGAFSGQWTCESYHIVIWDDEPRFTGVGDDIEGIFIGRHVYWFTGKGYTLVIVAAGTYGRLFRPFFWELFGEEPNHSRLPEHWYAGFSFIGGTTADSTLLHRWQISLAQLVHTYDKSTPELWRPPYHLDWIVGESRPHGSRALVQLALRVREGDSSHLQHNEFGVPRDSIGHMGVIGFVEASVSGSLRRPRELNSVGSLWIYPPLPIISDREEPRESKAEASEEPLESKAEACEYRVGPVEEDHEQAAEFERLKSDSEGDDEQAGGISIPYDCVAQIAVAEVEEREVHRPSRRVEVPDVWSYSANRIQYPPIVTCLVCEVQVSGRANWLAHLNGKKHEKKLKRRAREGSIYWSSVCEVCNFELEPYRMCRDIHYRIAHNLDSTSIYHSHLDASPCPRPVRLAKEHAARHVSVKGWAKRV